jgi:TPP-dependent 2-oxoacid decarboxylase
VVVLWDCQVSTERELTEALHAAFNEHKDKLCFVEVKLHPEDCSHELLEWGARIAAYNARPPQIH